MDCNKDLHGACRCPLTAPSADSVLTQHCFAARWDAKLTGFCIS
jgi:hypothetical protein